MTHVYCWHSCTMEKSLLIKRNMEQFRFKFCLIESVCMWAAALRSTWASSFISFMAKVYRDNTDTEWTGKRLKGCVSTQRHTQANNCGLTWDFSDTQSCAGTCHLHRSSGAGRLLELLSLATTHTVISFIQIHYIRYNTLPIIFVSMTYLNLQLCVSPL